ncbi:MAG: ABC transporter permease [Pseudomonadota bacterium]
MTDATAGPRVTEATPSGQMLAADGSPLKKSLARALRRQKIRALLLIAPLLLFILVTFIAPIADMLFRSVENQIVADTLPRTSEAIQEWDYESGQPPGEDVFRAFSYDLAIAAERKQHTRLGTRLNYESPGLSSLFRKSGRGVGDIGEIYQDQFEDLNEAWEEPTTWATLLGAEDWVADQAAWAADEEGDEPRFRFAPGVRAALPATTELYAAYTDVIQVDDEDSVMEEDVWPAVYQALYEDLATSPDLSAVSGPTVGLLNEAQGALGTFERADYVALFEDIDEDWLDPQVWGVIKTFTPDYTPGYFLASVDLQKTPDGFERQPEDQRIYILLFERTIFMSLAITIACILLGYPIAYLLASLPLRTSNVLLILVLLPFWTSLLVRTSSWKVLLQQQGVINDILVFMGLVGDGDRLVMINNQFGTIVAMTHILLPFMILPLYSVMKTIPPSYVRAAKSLGATNWTAFWRVYFPQSVPGIGAGCILVFILAIGYYITPELVGGTTGTFISNRIAYHISASLNWGLAAALGTLLLALVLALYWVYDRIVGIDNVSLG